jgi:probable HAF family extracellular repeat protein
MTGINRSGQIVGASQTDTGEFLLRTRKGTLRTGAFADGSGPVAPRL